MKLIMAALLLFLPVFGAEITPEQVQTVYNHVFEKIGMVMSALYAVAALDPTNKVARYLDRANKFLKVFAPFDKKKNI